MSEKSNTFGNKVKAIFFSTWPRKIMSSIIIIIGIIIISVVIIVNVTPKPMALFARTTLFAGDANATPFDNYNEIEGNVIRTKDLSYGQSEIEKFDVYQPKDDKLSNGKPTLIWVHGGGFVGGDKDMLKYYATTLANEGYTIMALNYELAPEKQYPTPIKQLTSFIEYLKEDQTYQVDLDNIVLVGDSAGAQIVSQFAITQTNLDYAKEYDFKVVLNPNSIKGMLLYCGPYDFREFVDSKSSIIRFIFKQVGWSYLG
ncbi:MAG: alpha/beta hydrolase, partial [Bacilli bacterium]